MLKIGIWEESTIGFSKDTIAEQDYLREAWSFDGKYEQCRKPVLEDRVPCELHSTNFKNQYLREGCNLNFKYQQCWKSIVEWTVQIECQITPLLDINIWGGGEDLLLKKLFCAFDLAMGGVLLNPESWFAPLICLGGRVYYFDALHLWFTDGRGSIIFCTPIQSSFDLARGGGI